MNLESYRIFCSVASTGNILRASEKLFISQPAVSKAIRQFETDMGCKLFIRSSRGVRLTKQGEILYKYASEAMSLLATGKKKVSEYENLNYGEIVVGVSDTLCKYYLTPYLNTFNAKFPNIKIHIKCNNTPETVRLLKDGQVDIAIVASSLKDEKLSFLPIMQIQDCFIAGEKYKSLAAEKRHLSELAAYPIILLTGTSNSRQFINDYFKLNSFEVEPAFELGNFDLLTHFARNNFGIACVMKNFIKEDLKQGRLFEIDLYEKIPKRYACIAQLTGTESSPASIELIRLMTHDEIPVM